MLSNLVIGAEKFVLFVDHNEFERVSDKIIHTLVGDASSIVILPKVKNSSLAEIKFQLDIEKELSEIKEKSNILLPRVEQLALDYSIQDTVKLVHKLRHSKNTRQIFAWATTKNIFDPKIIPFLEHLADIVVTLKNDKHLMLLIKRSGGSVSRKQYQYQISDSYAVSVKERRNEQTKKDDDDKSVNPESITTFKINFDEDESMARSALKLPYEKSKSGEEQPQIHYEPDSDDDFDYEDPDEDLYI